MSVKKIAGGRYRSPCYSQEEVNALINLVEKYKEYILNKSCTTGVVQAKTKAWTRIEKEYNSMGLQNYRSVDNLVMKWQNLKRELKRVSTDVNGDDFGAMNKELGRVAALVAQENSTASYSSENILEEDDNVNELKPDSSSENDSDSDEDLKDYVGDRKRRRFRSSNFTNLETRLLLDCVKKEKKYILCKETKTVSNKKKNSAWARVTNAYNKLSPEKRTTKSLIARFRVMKRMANYFGTKTKDSNKDQKPEILDPNLDLYLFNDIKKKIKQEPIVEDKLKRPLIEQKADDSDTDDDHTDDKLNKINGDRDHRSADSCLRSPEHDPLSAVLNSDSGIGSSHAGSWNWNGSENNEIAKLKQDLLNYQLETAKLERKRIEALIQEDEMAKSARATETALRLRAARLEAIAAAMKFPPAHPALQFTQEETRAQYLLSQVVLPNGALTTPDTIFRY